MYISLLLLKCPEKFFLDSNAKSRILVERRYRKKVDHYKTLQAIELSRLWQKRVTMIPVTVGSPG